jgi:[ribosomal protein S18]-alanine N-acetyltransferase
MTALCTTSPSVWTAGAGDASAMAAIHADCFARSWDERAMLETLAVPGTLSLFAARAADEPPQGLLIARTATDEAEILTLCIQPSHRRRGLAQALLATAIVALRASRARRLFLEVEEGNAAALALYRGAGATEVGGRRGYYEHGANAAIFCLAL